MEAPKPDRGQNKEEDDEYQKFEEELAQDLSGLKRSYVEVRVRDVKFIVKQILFS